MKNCTTLSILAASLTLLAACGGSEALTIAHPTEISVPTQDEADQAATDAIDDANADEELDKLMDEIGE